MQGAGIDIRVLAEVVTSLIGLAGFVILLMIKNNQASVKEELVEKQNEMREDMDKKHAENSKAIAVHQAADEAKFDSISRTLVRMDGKLDRLNGHS